jgi:hypothetical protein
MGFGGGHGGRLAKVFQGELNFTRRNCFRESIAATFADFLYQNNESASVETPKNNRSQGIFTKIMNLRQLRCKTMTVVFN